MHYFYYLLDPTIFSFYKPGKYNGIHTDGPKIECYLSIFSLLWEFG